MANPATVHMLEESTAPELPAKLPESGRLMTVRLLLQALHRQLDRTNREPLDPDLAGLLCEGFLAWTEGSTLEKGLGLESKDGQDTRRAFWLGLRNRHLAEAFKLLGAPKSFSMTARARALAQALQAFEVSRYPVWKAGPGHPPPEASQWHQVAYKTLHSAERCGGWPANPQRLLEAIEKGAVLLLDETE